MTILVEFSWLISQNIPSLLVSWVPSNYSCYICLITLLVGSWTGSTDHNRSISLVKKRWLLLQPCRIPGFLACSMSLICNVHLISFDYWISHLLMKWYHKTKKEYQILKQQYYHQYYQRYVVWLKPLGHSDTMYKVLVISVIDHARSKAGVSSCCHHSQWRTLLLALNPWLTMIPMKFEIWRNIPFFKDPQMKTVFFFRDS